MYKSKQILVNSKYHNYPVNFQRLEFGELARRENILILLDSNLAKIVNNHGQPNVIKVEPGEKTKDYSEAAKILELLAMKGVNRCNTLVVVGGGSLQDLGTFVSSIYMRGIEWEFYPTTLQAMVDSCIGGKSAINLGKHKNLIGNYYPPRRVTVDAMLTKSLTRYDVACGLIEALKISYAAGEQVFKKFLKLLDTNLNSTELDPELIEEIIYLSLMSKKFFVEKDEFDIGPRQMLNFGHTYGHAIEASTSFMLHHGVAVGIGMLASFEHRTAKKLTEVESKFVGAVKSILKPFSEEIKSTMASLDQDSFFESLQKDKKSNGKNLTFIHSNLGKLEKVSLPNNTKTRMDAYRSIDRALNAIQ